MRYFCVRKVLCATFFKIHTGTSKCIWSTFLHPLDFPQTQMPDTAAPPGIRSGKEIPGGYSASFPPQKTPFFPQESAFSPLPPP